MWAAQTLGGSLHVVAINKDLLPHTIVVRGTGVPYARTATISVLRAPATPLSTTCPYPLELTGLCARAGVTLGGATFGPADQAGGDHTSTGVLGPPPPHTCTLLVRCTVQQRRGEVELTLAPGTATILAGGPPPPPSRSRRPTRPGAPSGRHKR